MNEVWFKFDSDDDDGPSHEANVTMTEDGFTVEWSNVDVGQVTRVKFDTLEDAYEMLWDSGYVYYGVGDE